ncbi:hypothetical protein [Marinobacter sp. OP 3.4]|uniref:hypothetical protein n=1 Tax=Marinobacter sp. OP 3.4 TaxID=3076501 RepID=UPI002E1DA816
MSDQQPRENWHVSKTINITHLLTTMAMLLSALWYLAGQDTRISQAELNIRHLQDQRVQDRETSEKKFDELKTDLRLINSKLDRLIENQTYERP